MIRISLLLFICFQGITAHAFEVPQLRYGVNDYANIVDDRAERQLSTALEEIQRKGGPQLAVLTMQTIGDETIEDASIKVAKSWKLGTEAKDNGILLFVAVKERKVRIEVGQGVEGDLTDAYSKRIIDQMIVPLFREGHFSDGVLLGAAGILMRMDPPIRLDDYMQINRPARAEKKELSWLHILILFIIFIVMASTRGGRGFMAGLLLGSLSGGRGGGGFGGRGGFGGGGGGFSGGGASGSW